MTKFDEVVEFILATATAVVAPFDPVMGTLTGFVLWTWQKDNAKDYGNTVEEKFRRIDRHKLDKTYLASDEFKELVVQTVEVASQTASKRKREALASALVNSSVSPNKFLGKQALLRVVSQMSDEEIIALTVLYECETVGKDEFNLEGNGKPIISLDDVFKKVKPKMGQEWSEEDNSVAYGGLAQLGLVKAPQHLLLNSEVVRITALGNRVIQWCSDEYEKEQGSEEVSG